jgi:hypothetical protein
MTTPDEIGDTPWALKKANTEGDVFAIANVDAGFL